MLSTSHDLPTRAGLPNCRGDVSHQRARLRCPLCLACGLSQVSTTLPPRVQFCKMSLTAVPSEFSSVQSLSCVQLFATPWTAAFQASLSITNSQSLLKLLSIESVMPSNHLILCHPLLLPSIFPSIRVFPNDSALHIRWPKYWSFSFSISPSDEYSGLISFGMDWLDLLAVSRVFSNTTVQKHQFFGAQLSL